MDSCIDINTNRRKWRILGYIFIILVNLVHASNYFANTFPASEGWFVNYAELLMRGNVPYRDFFYYLPPLTLFLDVVFWKLSFGYLLVFRGWYLLERIIIFLLIYRLLSKYYKWEIAALACAISCILCTADDFDFFGDYNQNAMLLTVVLAYTSTAFAESNSPKAKIRNLFLSGIVIGGMFLCKQTIFLSSVLCYFLALTILCIAQKDKNIWKYCLFVFTGMMLPILAVAVYLIANGAFLAFIDQVFLSVSGKGSIWSILVTSPLKPMTDWKGWMAAFILWAILEIGNYQSLDGKIKDRLIGILTISLMCYFISAIDMVEYLKALCTLESFIALTGVSAFILSLVGYHQKRKQTGSDLWIILGVAFSGLLICFGVSKSVPAYTALYGLYSTPLVSSHLNSIFFYFFLLIFVFRFCSILKTGEYTRVNLSWIMLACSALSVCYATAMAAGLDILASNSMRIVTPLVLCILLSVNSTEDTCKKGIVGFKIVIIVWCILLCTNTIARKSMSAYPWWGCYNEPKEYKNYTVDNIPELKGIRFAGRDKVMYERVTKLIRENSSEDDVIFGYPYIKVFNILCHRYNTNFVPVIWYDVVGDKYVELTIREFSTKLPEIIVWMDIPGAKEAHESIYRNGEPLVQRELEEMLQQEINEKYTRLGRVYGVNVFRLDDEYR